MSGADDALTVLGMQSGTSVDAIDTALVRFARDADDPGHLRAAVLAVDEHPWDPQLRRDLLAALPPAAPSAETVLRLHTRAGDAFGAAAARALDRAGRTAAARARGAGHGADLIASHGQTLFHGVDPDGAAWGTLQIGDPSRIAAATGLPVLSDLRAADVAAGGQGAPLVPLLDQLALGETPTAVLNIGGIGNVSIVGAGDVIAGDTGPGNALMDAAVQRATGGAESADLDGRLARAGSVDPGLLERLLADPFYAQPFPRSTGRERFTADYVDALAPGGAGQGLSIEDLLATLLELTARTIADAIARLGQGRGLTRVVGSGGGMRNPALRARLAELLDPLPLLDADEVGLPADAKEAILFALIGWMSAHGLPGVPARADGTAVTGAARPVVLGSLTPATSSPASPGSPSPRAWSALATSAARTAAPARPPAGARPVHRLTVEAPVPAPATQENA